MIHWGLHKSALCLIPSPHAADKKGMEFILERTFEASDFLPWYHQARVGDSCTVILPAMQEWHLTIIKTSEDNHLLLNPDGKRPRPIALPDLLRMLESMQRAMVARVK